MKNKSLEKFYTEVYENKEENHYTTLRLKNRPQQDADQAFKAIKWKNKKVLEVGCGTGRFASMIADAGADVLAIDFSESAIRLAKQNHIHPNLNFKKMNVNDIRGKYDIIASLGTLEHMDDPFKTLKKFKRHLNPKGKIILTNPNWTNPRGFVLLTLYYLFDAKITLADNHFLTPVDHKKWAKKLGMKLKWKTIEHSWGNGTLLIDDLKRRLPKVLPDKEKKIDRFLSRLEDMLAMNYYLPQGGAVGLYIYE